MSKRGRLKGNWVKSYTKSQINKFSNNSVHIPYNLVVLDADHFDKPTVNKCSRIIQIFKRKIVSWKASL